MKNALTASEFLWDQQQREKRIQSALDLRAWLKNFALVLALIVLTLTVAAVLAGQAASGTADRASSVDHRPSPARHLVRSKPARKPLPCESAQQKTTLARLVH